MDSLYRSPSISLTACKKGSSIACNKQQNNDKLTTKSWIDNVKAIHVYGRTGSGLHQGVTEWMRNKSRVLACFVRRPKAITVNVTKTAHAANSTLWLCEGGSYSGRGFSAGQVARFLCIVLWTKQQPKQIPVHCTCAHASLGREYFRLRVLGWGHCTSDSRHRNLELFLLCWCFGNIDVFPKPFVGGDLLNLLYENESLDDFFAWRRFTEHLPRKAQDEIQWTCCVCFQCANRVEAHGLRCLCWWLPRLSRTWPACRVLRVRRFRVKHRLVDSWSFWKELSGRSCFWTTCNRAEIKLKFCGLGKTKAGTPKHIPLGLMCNHVWQEIPSQTPNSRTLQSSHRSTCFSLTFQLLILWNSHCVHRTSRWSGWSWNEHFLLGF